MKSITLRPYKLSDVDDFMEWASDEEVIRRSRLSHYPTRAHALNYLQEVALAHPWYRAVCLNGRAVGYICLDWAGPGLGRCRGALGYALGRQYWGWGIMAAVVRKAVEEVAAEVEEVAAEVEEVERVEAVVDVENKASQRVLQKVGFVEEGVLRKYIKIDGKATDVVMYSVLCEDLVGINNGALRVA